MNIQTLTCPHCGNSNIEEIELRIERPTLLYHPLYKDEKGGIHGKDRAIDEQELNHQTSSDLYCRGCHQAFDNPGILLK